MIRSRIAPALALASAALLLPSGAMGQPAKASARDTAQAAKPGNPSRGGPAASRPDSIQQGGNPGAGKGATAGKEAGTGPSAVTYPGGTPGTRTGRADTTGTGMPAPRDAKSVDAKPTTTNPATTTSAAKSPAAGPTAPAPAAATGAAQETARLDTLVGEVLDIQCMARNERLKGQSPQGASADKGWGQCGTDAVRRGAPVGLRLKDGNQVLVAAMYDRKPAGRTLAQYVGKEVTVAGYRRPEAGVPLLEITEVIRSGDARTSQAENKD